MDLMKEKEGIRGGGLRMADPLSLNRRCIESAYHLASFKLTRSQETMHRRSLSLPGLMVSLPIS